MSYGRVERPLARAELAARPVPEQDARPDHRVEHDVVLAHEIQVARVGVLPPVAPGLGRPAVHGPLDGRRQVADDRVEPDIDSLVVALRVFGRHRDRHAPIEVAGDRPRLQILEQPEREVPDVRAPMTLPLDPLGQLLRERRKVEEEVARFPEDRRRPVDLRARVDQVDRIELVPAVVALVTAGVLEPADRARPFDVAVGERVTGGGRERAHRRLLDDVAVLVDGPEQVLDHAVVVLRRRPREQVVRQTEVVQVLADEAAVPIGGLTRGQTLAIGRDHDRRAVLVGAADHQHVVAPQPVIPGRDVRRNAEAGDMPQMPRATRVGPRDGDENALLSTVREGVPPGRARSRTSYGGAVGRTDAGRPAAGDADRRRRAPRVRSRPRRAGSAASASSDPAALPRPASRVASRRRSGPGQQDVSAAPAQVSGAPRKVERASSAHERLALGTASAEHAEPALSGTAASASGSQAHALSRAAASPRIVADTRFRRGRMPAPRGGARRTGLTRRHRRSRSLHR